MVRYIRSSLVVAMVIAAAPAAKAADDLSLLPVDSEIVGGLDFQQLQGSALWKEFIEPQLNKGDAKKQLDEMKQKCGLDAMKVVSKLAFGIKVVNDKPEGAVVMHGMPNKAKVLACYEKRKAEKDNQFDRDGDVLVSKPSANSKFAMMFIDDTTAFMVFGPNGTAKGVKDAAKGTSTLKDSAAFKEFYKKTNTNDTFWGILNGNASFLSSVKSTIPAKAYYGSLNVTKDLTLDLKLRFGSPDEAKTFVAMAQCQTKAATGMVDKLNIAADGNDAKISVLLSDAKLKALAKQFGPMMKKP
jgi:hypothetical protein